MERWDLFIMPGMHGYKGDIIDIWRPAPGEGTGYKAVITCNMIIQAIIRPNYGSLSPNEQGGYDDQYIHYIPSPQNG